MMDDREARNDFRLIEGNYIYRHHVEPGVQLHLPKEESLPIPLRYIDVTLNVLQESRINDFWNIDSD